MMRQRDGRHINQSPFAHFLQQDIGFENKNGPRLLKFAITSSEARPIKVPPTFPAIQDQNDLIFHSARLFPSQGLDNLLGHFNLLRFFPDCDILFQRIDRGRNRRRLPGKRHPELIVGFAKVRIRGNGLLEGIGGFVHFPLFIKMTPRL